MATPSSVCRAASGVSAEPCVVVGGFPCIIRHKAASSVAAGREAVDEQCPRANAALPDGTPRCSGRCAGPGSLNTYACSQTSTPNTLRLKHQGCLSQAFRSLPKAPPPLLLSTARPPEAAVNTNKDRGRETCSETQQEQPAVPNTAAAATAAADACSVVGSVCDDVFAIFSPSVVDVLWAGGASPGSPSPPHPAVYRHALPHQPRRPPVGAARQQQPAEQPDAGGVRRTCAPGATRPPAAAAAPVKPLGRGSSASQLSSTLRQAANGAPPGGQRARAASSAGAAAARRVLADSCGGGSNLLAGSAAPPQPPPPQVPFLALVAAAAAAVAAPMALGGGRASAACAPLAPVGARAAQPTAAKAPPQRLVVAQPSSAPPGAAPVLGAAGHTPEPCSAAGCPPPCAAAAGAPAGAPAVVSIADPGDTSWLLPALPPLLVARVADCSGHPAEAAADAARATGVAGATLLATLGPCFEEPRGHVHNGPRVPMPTSPLAQRPLPHAETEPASTLYATLASEQCGEGRCCDADASLPASPMSASSQASTIWEHPQAHGYYVLRALHRPQWSGAQRSRVGASPSMGALQVDPRAQWWGCTGFYSERDNAVRRRQLFPFEATCTAPKRGFLSWAWGRAFGGGKERA